MQKKRQSLISSFCTTPLINFLNFNSGKEVTSSLQIRMFESNVFINLRQNVRLLFIIIVILLCYTARILGSAHLFLQVTMDCAFFCHVSVVCITGKYIKTTSIAVLVCINRLYLFLLHQKLMWISTSERNCFLNFWQRIHPLLNSYFR